jgi:hypothetical protein
MQLVGKCLDFRTSDVFKTRVPEITRGRNNKHSNELRKFHIVMGERLKRDWKWIYGNIPYIYVIHIKQSRKQLTITLERINSLKKKFNS